jgi:hypothetical protein
LWRPDFNATEAGFHSPKYWRDFSEQKLCFRHERLNDVPKVIVAPLWPPEIRWRPRVILLWWRENPAVDALREIE